MIQNNHDEETNHGLSNLPLHKKQLESDVWFPYIRLNLFLLIGLRSEHV